MNIVTMAWIIMVLCIPAGIRTLTRTGDIRKLNLFTAVCLLWKGIVLLAYYTGPHPYPIIAVNVLWNVVDISIIMILMMMIFLPSMSIKK